MEEVEGERKRGGGREYTKWHLINSVNQNHLSTLIHRHSLSCHLPPSLSLSLSLSLFLSPSLSLLSLCLYLSLFFFLAVWLSDTSCLCHMCLREPHLNTKCQESEMGGIFPSVHLCPARSTGPPVALRKAEPRYQPWVPGKQGNQATTVICESLKGTVVCLTGLLHKLILSNFYLCNISAFC